MTFPLKFVKSFWTAHFLKLNKVSLHFYVTMKSLYLELCKEEGEKFLTALLDCKETLLWVSFEKSKMVEKHVILKL